MYLLKIEIGRDSQLDARWIDGWRKRRRVPALARLKRNLE